MCEQKLSVFSADYWRAARRELNNPRVLALFGAGLRHGHRAGKPAHLPAGAEPENLLQNFLAVSLGCYC